MPRVLRERKYSLKSNLQKHLRENYSGKVLFGEVYISYGFYNQGHL